MNTGIVKFFNVRRGFGAIIDDESGEEVFVHSTSIIDKIVENDKVQYEIVSDTKGLKAINVKML